MFANFISKHRSILASPPNRPFSKVDPFLKAARGIPPTFRSFSQTISVCIPDIQCIRPVSSLSVLESQIYLISLRRTRVCINDLEILALVGKGSPRKVFLSPSASSQRAREVGSYSTDAFTNLQFHIADPATFRYVLPNSIIIVVI